MGKVSYLRIWFWAEQEAETHISVFDTEHNILQYSLPYMLESGLDLIGDGGKAGTEMVKDKW